MESDLHSSRRPYLVERPRLAIFPLEIKFPFRPKRFLFLFFSISAQVQARWVHLSSPVKVSREKYGN